MPPEVRTDKNDSFICYGYDTNGHLDESDLNIICQIIEAAIWYTMNQKVEIELPVKA